MAMVQEEYQTSIRRLTVKERVARSVALFQWSREIIARQIRRESHVNSNERLKWLVALRQYGRDPRMRTMIKRELDRVSD
jgi:hypothetical protein